MSKGKIPVELERTRAVYVKTIVTCSKAWDAYNQAWIDYDQDEDQRQEKDVRNKTRDAYNKTNAARKRARDDYAKAWDVAQAEIEKLHAQECPNCPWDGDTIFPEKSREQ